MAGEGLSEGFCISGELKEGRWGDERPRGNRTARISAQREGGQKGSRVADRKSGADALSRPREDGLREHSCPGRVHRHWKAALGPPPAAPSMAEVASARALGAPEP